MLSSSGYAATEYQMSCFEAKLFPVIRELKIGDGATCRAFKKARTAYYNISKIAPLDLDSTAAAQLTRLRTSSQGGVGAVTSPKMSA